MRKRLVVSVVLSILVAACVTTRNGSVPTTTVSPSSPPAAAPATPVTDPPAPAATQAATQALAAPTADPPAPAAVQTDTPGSPEPEPGVAPAPAATPNAGAARDAGVTPDAGATRGTAGQSGADAPPRLPDHVDVRGVFMTGYTAGSAYFYQLVDFMVEAGLNAMVIDVKDDTGYLSWPMDIPLAAEIGANVSKIPDIGERIRYLKERGIYPIARVVCYADPLLGSRRPDLAIMGGQFADGRGIRWPNPYNRDVWEYNLAIAREAVRVGFSEVQFDYIRFPEIRIEGYNHNVPVSQRTDAIEGFLRYAVEELHKLGVYVSADVFGLTTSVAEGDDMEIGQNYANIAAIVDYIKPMIYPSHYAPYTFGVPDPNAAPDRIVYESMVRAQKRTWDLPVRKHRPWIQDFDLGKDYTAADVEAQIRGLAEAGIYQWILWDPHNRYTRDANYAIAPPTDAEPAWRAAYREELAAQARAEAEAEAAAPPAQVAPAPPHPTPE